MTSLRRSRREIEAARLLADGGFCDQAISRAYYAAFYAADLGKAYAGLGKAAEARASLQRAIELAPDEVEYQKNLEKVGR